MKHYYKKLTPYLIVVLFVGIIGGVLFSGCTNFAGEEAKSKVQAAQPNLQVPVNTKLSDARNTPVVRVAQAVGPAVVGITNKATARDWFNNKVTVEQGSGSGVIIDANGYIVTNNHVVQGAEEIVVSLSDGRTLNGKVLGSDPATDLAVVKVDAKDLPFATLGNSDEIMVGEPAIAIGNPLGQEFKGSVTTGVISALNRSIEIGERRFKLIQTDAAINPGNSGGALVNADGMVIGINSAKISVAGVEGIGLAIPANTVRPIVQAIIEKGKVARPYLGVGAFDKDSAARQGYQLNIDAGVYIANVSKGGPAEKAGIKKGDIILKINDEAINSVVDLRTVIANYEVDKKVNVELDRDGNKTTVEVKLEEMPANE
jgi:serine protease Do